MLKTQNLFYTSSLLPIKKQFRWLAKVFKKTIVRFRPSYAIIIRSKINVDDCLILCSYISHFCTVKKYNSYIKKFHALIELVPGKILLILIPFTWKDHWQ